MLTKAQREIFTFLFRMAINDRVTPSVKQTATATGRSESGVQSILGILRDEGLISCDYGTKRSLHKIGVMTKKGWRYTHPPTDRGRVPTANVAAFGGGPIAKMKNRTKAERLIAKVFSGKLTEAEAQAMAT